MVDAYIISVFRSGCKHKIRKGEAMPALYERYASMRDERKLSDSEVSKSTQISQPTFSDWKSGRSTPKLDKIKRIADYFGVSIEEFIKD